MKKERRKKRKKEKENGRGKGSRRKKKRKCCLIFFNILLKGIIKNNGMDMVQKPKGVILRLVQIVMLSKEMHEESTR